MEGTPVVQEYDADRGELLRRIVTIFGNVGVVGALLVYFGWVRSQVQARLLGIDESILGMSSREYMLRSVRPVLVLLIVIGLAGLLWVMADHWLLKRLHHHGAGDRIYRRVAAFLPTAIVLLPLAGWFARSRWDALAYIAFPLLCAAGLLLLLYGLHLRQVLPRAVTMSVRSSNLLRACTAALIGVALFSTASNYATVEGTELALAFEEQVPMLPEVVVHSIEPLNIEAPGAALRKLADDAGFTYQYSGLRLLEHSGGRYFLISEDWSMQFGVVVVLEDDAPGVRYDFVRDAR